jgi:AraC-like DNA-binding protein
MMDLQLKANLERADGPPLIAYRATGGLPVEETDWHSHVRGQLFYVESGLFIARTARGAWMLPPQRAGWMPPGLLHTIEIRGPSSGWGVFIAPCAADGLPEQACVVGVNDLLRSLVRRASSWDSNAEPDVEQRRILDVLLDEIRRAPVEALHVPIPDDRRLRRVAVALMAQPDDTRSVDDWAAFAGMSTRTLTRLFRQETACSFAQWRQHARLACALERLARGEAVNQVADALGYATPSAFVAMFRRAFGQSPGRYFDGSAVAV